MNKIFKYSMMFPAALAFTMGFTSCSDDDNDEQDVTFSSSELKEVNADYVDNTVVATYRNLADYNKQLVADLNAMSDDAGVAKACETWTQSRNGGSSLRLSSSELPATMLSTLTQTHGHSTALSLTNT